MNTRLFSPNSEQPPSGFPRQFLALPVLPGQALIELVTEAGWGLFFDLHAPGPEEIVAAAEQARSGQNVWLRLFEPAPGTLEQLARLPVKPWRGVYLSRSHWDDRELKTLESLDLPTGLIIQERKDLEPARRFGQLPLIARGHEAGGFTGPLGTLVLLQVMCRHAGRPFLIEGGLGMPAAPAAIQAGAAGVILGAALWGCEQMPDHLRKAARTLRAHEIMRISGEDGFGLNFGIKPKPDLLSLKNQLVGRMRHEWRTLLGPEALLVGQDIELGRRLTRENPDLGKWLRDLKKAIDASESPSGAENALPGEGRWARELDCPLPIVQGPMARISDSPSFLHRIDVSGAMPVLAFASLPEDQCADLWRKTRECCRHAGVGIIGLDLQMPLVERQLGVLENERPVFVLVAAPSPHLVERLLKRKFTVLAHAPHVMALQELWEIGCRRFILEGNESGGHIGRLSSVVLWQLALEEVAAGEMSDKIRLVFAGGLATRWGMRFLRSLIGRYGLGERLSWGVQLGTAYLATREAVDSGAMSRNYRNWIINEERTLVTGESIGLRARQVATPFVHGILSDEDAACREGLSLPERRIRFEHANLGNLARAATSKEGEDGCFMAGESVALLDAVQSMDELHTELLGPHFVSQSRSTSIATGTKEPEQESIAIIGLGCVFPGCPDPRRFFENLLARRCFIRSMPEDRLDSSLFFREDPGIPLSTYSRIGSWLDPVDFDATLFRIPPRVAGTMDLGQKLALICARQALLDAGLLDSPLFDRERVAVIIGNSMGGGASVENLRAVHHHELSLRLRRLADETGVGGLMEKLLDQARKEAPVLEITEDSLPGELSSLIAGRVAAVFDLHGPNYTVDAACGSGLAAVNASVQALRQRNIDLALTGGVDTQMDPGSFIKFSKVTALSGRGSFPFDHRADGFVMGEGAGIIVLKRLSDAVRDGNRVYALILGIGQSSDGKGKGITAPNPEGQRRAISRAWQEAGIPFSRVSYLEAHGTGTRVGDEIELSAAAGLLGTDGPLGSKVPIGSVKANLGHTKAAAGIAGLLKAVWVLHQRVVPPQPNFERFPETWQQQNLPFEVCRTPTSLPDGSLYAGVSSFGFGGTNHHVALGEAPEKQRKSLRLSLPTDLAPDLPVLCPQGEGNPNLAHGVVTQAAEKTALMFPGQGSQYVGMLECWLSDPVFKETLRQADEIFARLNPHQPKLFSHIYPDNRMDLDEESKALLENRLRNTVIAQPAILAVSCGLLEVLRHRGLKAEMVFGHSLGEYSALYAAGVLSLEGILEAVCIRAQYMGSLPRGDLGAMGVVAASDSDVQAVMETMNPATRLADDLKEYVTVANRNAPRQTVVSGATEAVERLLKQFSDRGILARRLPVSAAFHSLLVAGAVPLFRQKLESMPWMKPSLAIPANLTGEWYPSPGPDSEANEQDWKNRIIELLSRQVTGTVDFVDQVERAWANGVRTFIEVGPKNVLCRLVDEILGSRPHRCLHTDHPRQNGVELVDQLFLHRRERLPSSPGQSGKPSQSVVSDTLTSTNQSKTSGSLEEIVLQTIEEISGYPRSMIRPELDLEADLGIDTLKIFEIAGRLRKRFPGLGVKRLDPARIRTMQGIVELVRSSVPVGESPHAPAGSQKTEPREPSLAAQGGTASDGPAPAPVTRFLYRVVTDPAAKTQMEPEIRTFLQGKNVLVRATGKPEFDEAMAGRFREMGAIPLMAPLAETELESLEQGRLPEDWREIQVFVHPIAHERFGRKHRKSFYREQILHLFLVCRALGKQLRGVLILSDLGGDLEQASTHQSGTGFLTGVLPALCKALLKDFPDLHARAVDLPEFSPGWIDRALQIGFSPGWAAMVGLGRDGRLTRHEIFPSPLLEGETTASEHLRELLPRGSVILATGGGAGITAHLLRRLAGEIAPRLIILGRSPDRSGVVQELRRAGAEVWYLSCDLADGPAVDRTAEVIRRAHPKIDLLIHGAGIEISRHLSNKTPEEIDRTYRVKVAGLVNLIDALGEEQIGAVVSFSSVAALFGNPGQVDYAAANGFLNAFSGKGRSHFLSLAWSAWDRIGMASRGPIHELLQANGVTFITPEEGERFFLTELSDFLQHKPLQRTVGFFGDLGPGLLEPEWFSSPADQQQHRFVLDPDKASLLWDHALAGRCVIPGVFSLFHLARTLWPEQMPEWVRFEGLRFESPVKRSRGEPARFAVVPTGGRFDLMIEDPSGACRCHLQTGVSEGQVDAVARQRWVDQFERLELVLNDSETGLSSRLQHQVISHSDLYSIFFHGPSFQVLGDIRRWSDTVLEAVPIPSHGFADWETLCQGFLWPYVLESALHAAGVMCLLKVASPDFFLPRSLAHLSIRSDAGLNLAGMRILVEFLGQEKERLDTHSLVILRFNVMVTDSGRRPVAVLHDLRMVAGRDRPADLKTFISTGFSFTIGDVDLMTVTTTDALTLGADPVWMRSFLHPEEQAIFAGLEQEKRRFDWLAGRLAGKHLVCHTLRRLIGQEIAPATFALLSAGQAPRLEHLPEKAAQVLASRHLSLSHTDGRAVAGMAPFPVGVDMEKRRPILKEAVERAFSAREQAMVAPEDLIALWTAKEAVMKVLGSGLGTIDPLQLEIEDFCLHDSFFIRCAETVPRQGGPRFDSRSKGGPRFHCLTLRDHEYVMTLARPDPGSGFVK